MELCSIKLESKAPGIYESVPCSFSINQITLRFKKNRQAIDQYINRVTQLQLQLIEVEAKLADSLQEEKRLLAALATEV